MGACCIAAKPGLNASSSYSQVSGKEIATNMSNNISSTFATEDGV